MKIVYVVLHYMAGEDTIQCVNSILATATHSHHQVQVVVVDNCSPNDSLQTIKQCYKTESRVNILHNSENLGFARGNNVGFRYAKRQLQADFIVMLNNDTVLNQMEFNEVLVRKYEEKKYGVLGPDIVTRDQRHQNPGSKQSWNYSELKKDRLKKRIRILMTYFHLDKVMTGLIESTKDVYRKETLVGDVENTILHGACLIFSPIYLEQFDGLCEETFFYWEEDILKLYADYYGFLMLYSSELTIIHKEYVATNMAKGNDFARARTRYKRLIDSSYVYEKQKRRLEKEV